MLNEFMTVVFEAAVGVFTFTFLEVVAAVPVAVLEFVVSVERDTVVASRILCNSVGLKVFGLLFEFVEVYTGCDA